MVQNWRGKPGGYQSRYDHVCDSPFPYQSIQKWFERSQKRSGGSYQRLPPPGDFDPDLPEWAREVPDWEWDFVAKVGNISWGRFLDCHRGLELYKDVLNWDDSAGAEAFKNAKNRFWAERENLPFDIPLPDPDTSVDDMDNCDTQIDPEVCEDLEKALEPPPEEEEKDEAKLVDGVIYYKGNVMDPSGWDDYKVIKPTGWDSPDLPPNPLSSLMKPIISSGRVDGNEDLSKPVYGLSPKTTLLEGGTKASSMSNSWESSHRRGGHEPWGQRNQLKKKTSNSWEDGSEDLEKLQSYQTGITENTMGNSWKDNYRGWEEVPSGQRSARNNTRRNYWKNNNQGLKTVPLGWRNATNEYQDQNQSKNVGNWNSAENWRKKENEDQHPSRYKTTRHRPGPHQMNGGSKNNRGKKKVSFAQEHVHMEPLAPRRWN